MLDRPVSPVRGLIGVAFIISGIILFLFYTNDTITNNEILSIFEPKYLVFNSKCRIPDLNPFNPDAKRFYKLKSYESCSDLSTLTYVTKTDNIATLHVDSEVVPSYTKHGVYCCYSNVTRKTDKNNPDDHYKITDCKRFSNNVTTMEDVVLVRCYDSSTKREIYANAHTFVTIKKELKKKIEKIPENVKPISVLFVGIDSVSRLNLIRSLPETYQYLEYSDWVPLKGYNKMDDNTFPNLMAIFTGYNNSLAYSRCNPKQVGKLDKCPLLWYDFRKLGYITGYGEDEGMIGTFNYKKKGFTELPTDFYFRTYILAAEKLKIVHKDGMSYCTGPETSGERILNLARDFSMTLKNYPNFGVFWMNSFSHNDVNSPSRMDKKVKSFLVDLTNSGVLNSSIVIFLSDHGIRFGDIRYTNTGWLEERLPFIYLSIPEFFQKRFPEAYQNLKHNAYKLTCPYDLYLTFQHIIQLSGFNFTIKPSESCPLCKSLFLPVPNERSCEDAGIEPHWCTCQGYSNIDTQNATVLSGVKYIIEQIHQKIDAKRNKSTKCAKYALHKVISSRISDLLSYKNETYLIIAFESRPKAVFEATLLVDHGAKGVFQLSGGISRLDSYSSTGHCVQDTYLKMYCACKK